MKHIMWIIIACCLASTLHIPLSAQWIQLSAPGNGRVCDFAGTGHKLYAATQGTGIFFTTDNGVSWMPVNTGLVSLDIWSFASSDTKLYAGTQKNAIFSSIDYGANWSAVFTGRMDSCMTALLAFDTCVFAGTYPYNDILRSTDNGLTWDGWYLGHYMQSVYTIIKSDTNLFAGTCYGGAYRSTNHGSSWRSINTGLTGHYGLPPNTHDYIIDVFGLGACGSHLFAGLQSGIFVSTNSGDNWTSASNGLAGSYFYTFSVYANTVFVGGGNDGVYATYDNGANWRSVRSNLLDTMVDHLFIAGTNLFAGTNGGNVFRRPLSDMIAPSATNLVLPLNNAMNVPRSCNFVCKKVPLATGYHWQISSRSTFSSYAVNDTTIDTTRIVTLFADSTKYYWRVRAINPAGASAFSATRSFGTIGAFPNAPKLISPVNAKEVSRKTTFKWHSSEGAIRYHLQVTTGINPLPPTKFPIPRLVVDTILADTTKRLWKPLNAKKAYIWKVGAINKNGEGLSSVIARFTTGF
jgi:photosystem II stability/assembly factor-like uncharacterized protein